ncbi:hydroxypyruvate reductase [Raphidocelis subcapitata]|uniref:Hydroxypyruvate reductase n=1 Tax=Raphidocelis subcapitata TaxID=307507 RepID=A0A2V0PBH1_9CHLO|nr:hydroxypyruvate reductase [Raphidocelis subcapitata]|eukprot:GBF94517.1 hydroxypyruvate reductase [Raphidocelis subcapitata]
MALRNSGARLLRGLQPFGAAAAPNGARAASTASANGVPVEVHNPSGAARVVVTKPLPGDRWLQILTAAGCRVEVSQCPDISQDVATVKKLIGSRCDGVIGQLTEDWGAELFEALKAAGGRAYSNYAVGYNNVKVPEASKRGIPVGNTPGVLTETTAELAAALTLAAARRVPEADVFMRAGKYKGWLPDLFVGALLQNKTVGIVGAGRIGAAYARMMVEGHKMNLVYYDPYPNKGLEEYIRKYGELLRHSGEAPVAVRRVETVEEVLKEADVVSLHCNLDDTTRHLINAERLRMMKPNAVLVNAARGPCIDEAALVAHMKKHPDFRAGLDVFEHEPAMAPGLADLPNAVIVPHIASASLWTRSGMATLAAANVAGVIQGFGAWAKPNDITPFLDGPIPSLPRAAPSIVNAKEVGLPTAA